MTRDSCNREHNGCSQTKLHVYADAPDSYEILSKGVHVIKPSNVIIQFHASELWIPENHEHLSIRCAFNGARVYESNGGRFAVDDASYFVLNNGHDLFSSIQSDTEVESFSFFFWPGFAEEVLRGLVTPTDRLLDNPQASNGRPVEFFEKLYRHDDILSPLMMQLRDAVGKEWATHDWLEEQFHLLLERLLHVHRSIGREIEGLPAVRHATRVELYQRLHRARDFMDSSLEKPLSLVEIAEVAWFSPHHFLRAFKQVFGETPHQYLTRRRLERAQYLLTKTNHSISDICMEVGFESVGSFSWLFRRYMGTPPGAFRSRAENRRVVGPPAEEPVFLLHK